MKPNKNAKEIAEFYRTLGNQSGEKTNYYEKAIVNSEITVASIWIALSNMFSVEDVSGEPISSWSYFLSLLLSALSIGMGIWYYYRLYLEFDKKTARHNDRYKIWLQISRKKDLTNSQLNMFNKEDKEWFNNYYNPKINTLPFLIPQTILLGLSLVSLFVFLARKFLLQYPS